jgi:hypothetical protein
MPLWASAVPENPMGEGILGQEDTLLEVSRMCEIEVAIRLGDAENYTVVRLIVAPILQRHQIVCRPRSFIPASILQDEIQVLAALGTTTVLSDISRVLDVVVESHS